MSLLSWFDNRTLFGCQCMLTVMFAFVFLWMDRHYQTVRGLRSVAIGFLLGIPCTLLLVSRGHIPAILSVTVANVLAVTCFLLVNDGLMSFFGGRKYMGVTIAASVAGLAVVYYYSEVQEDIVPRIEAMALVSSLIRGFGAWELLRLSRGSADRVSNRGQMRFLGIFLAFLAVSGVDRAVVTAMHRAPSDFMQRNSAQTTTMVLNLIYIGVTGLCFVMMATHELITRSQAVSEQDSLSGALNRRGIEGRLAIEIGQFQRSQLGLSVALIDIDHFKLINDTQGHAAGDAAIRKIAGCIAEQLRGGDVVGRYGGDEFLVVLPQTNANHAEVVVERLRQAVHGLRLPGGADGKSQPLTLSIGITEASEGDDASSLLARADEALYLAKSAGRDCMRTILPAADYPAAYSARSEGISTKAQMPGGAHI